MKCRQAKGARARHSLARHPLNAAQASVLAKPAHISSAVLRHSIARRTDGLFYSLGFACLNAGRKVLCDAMRRRPRLSQ